MAHDNPDDEDYIPQNIHAEPIHVNFKDLERFDVSSAYKSICPVCRKGILGIARDMISFKLSKYDRCLLCAQTVIYDDLKEVFPHET